MAAPFFDEVTEPIAYEGPATDNPLAFRFYDAGREVLGSSMAEHLRPAVCYWHSFCWPGSDVFGAGTFDRPWLEAAAGDPVGAARQKMAAAFEFFEKLGFPFFCFHDVDLAPEGDSFAASSAMLDQLADEAGERMDAAGISLLWGTANLFSHPRYAGGAATNPDPDIFAFAAAQVCRMLEVTHRLGGHNYVLWGGREGYDTLLNTDLKQEADQLARFLHLVAEHKHRIGFEGTLLIEPKPAEPTKHQYDFDAAAVHGFLARYGLEAEYKLNLEVNHATLGGHSFHHEVAYAVANGLLGSVDANRGDPQNGWDTDQFPNSVEDMTLAVLEIVRGGGLGSGGFNFDTKLRRQSIDRTDLFHGHIGGIDTLARALLAVEAVVNDGTLDEIRSRRYEGWDEGLGVEIMREATLDELRGRALDGDFDRAQPRSGGQEALENLLNRFIYPR